MDVLRAREPAGETERALLRATELVEGRISPDDAIPQLGEGWIAEEAMAIAVYCAIAAPDFESGVRMAVNIEGDSDSVGAIAGNILGALHGEGVIPKRWLDSLELREVIGEVAEDFLRLPESREEDEERWWSRYPGF